MSSSPIIDARHRLRWYQRLLSDASTALLWGAWLWLWWPALRSFAWVAHLGARHHGTLRLLSSDAVASLEHCVAALVGTSGTLLVWSCLPRSRVRDRKARSLSDYARHFGLPKQAILAGRRDSVCVVHHDGSGRIVRLEGRGAGTRLAA
jgi:poly-beta-1,6-N-acetyl-D-glucosamine biosynthesis protein PgaD